jgi:hypothetical protein
MKKKAIYITVGVIGLGVFGTLVFKACLPSLVSYAMGKALGARVTAESAEVTLGQWKIRADLRNVVLRGALEGTVERFSVTLRVAPPIEVLEVTASGYDVTIPAAGATTWTPALPARSLALEKGRVTFEGLTLLVPEITLRGQGARDGLAFTLQAMEKDATGSLTASGTGAIRHGKVVLDGTLNLKGLYIGRWIKELDGVAEGTAKLSYDGEKLSINGPVAVNSFGFKEEFLRKPVTLARAEGTLALSAAKGICEIAITEIMYGETPVTLGFRVEKGRLKRFEMSSGFLELDDVHTHLDFTKLFTTDLKPREIIPEGKVRVAKLTVDRGVRGRADLEVKDAKVSVRDFAFSGIEGSVVVDEKTIRLSRLKGTLSRSSVYDVSGSIELRGNQTVEVSGGYTVDLADVPLLVPGAERKDLRFTDGLTAGSAQIRGKGAGPFQVQGLGTLRDAGVMWRKTSFKAEGNYRFQDREVSFDPLILRKGRSEVTIRGKWNNGNLDFMIKGMVEMESLRTLAELPLGLSGSVVLDGVLKTESGTVVSSGEVGMDYLSFEVPGVFRKAPGMASRAQLAFSLNREGGIRVEELLYDLRSLNLELRGTRTATGRIDAEVKLVCADMGLLAPLFFFEGTPSHGEMQAEFTVGDLILPLKRLPEVQGFAKIREGFFRLPGMKQTLRDVNLEARLKGEAAEVSLTGLRMGSTVLSKGAFHLENLEQPRFKLALNLDGFDPADVETEGSFRLTPLNNESLFARSHGEITATAKSARFGNTEGKGLSLKARLDGGRLDVEGLTAEILGGTAALTGDIDFVSDPPSMTAAGEVKGITSGRLLNALGGTAEMLAGKTDLSGRVSTRGKDPKGLMANLEGAVTTYSKDGVIKRWNILSKVLTLFSLNFYDMFQGKMDLTTEGIPYRTMGGLFNMKDGVVHTDNFIMDSPSMFIAGSGDINVQARVIDASLVVSPLLPIDTTIGKIPILGGILRGNERSFLYAAYTVKGSLDNPDINLSVARTVGGRALGWLKNLLFFPAEVLPK